MRQKKLQTIKNEEYTLKPKRLNIIVTCERKPKNIFFFLNPQIATNR